MPPQEKEKPRGGFCSKLFEQFKFLDLFGQPPLFTIRGDNAFKTHLGTLSSIVFLSILFYSLFHYFIIYYEYRDPDISTQSVKTDTYQAIDLGKQDFFISFLYRDSKKFATLKGFEATWLIIEAFYVTETQSNGATSGVAPTESRTKIEIKNCESVSIDKTDLKGSSNVALNSEASCIVFDEGIEIVGSASDDTFKYVEIIVRPCDEESSTCRTSGLNAGDTIGSNSKLQDAYKRLREITLEFNFMEAGVSLDNKTKPLTKTINTNYELRLDLFQEKFSTFYFQNFNVSDTEGRFLFLESTKEYNSITLDKVISQSTTRDPGSKDVKFFSPTGELSRSANYLTIKIQASNNEYTIERGYKKLIDVFADVGGVVEVITFVIAILYSWHNDIRMEQTLVNEGLLNARDNPEAKEFGYFEVLCWNWGCICCCKKKKDARRDAYERYKDGLDDRLNILNFLRRKGNQQVMQEALLKPYQRKLIPFLLVGQREGMEDEDHAKLQKLNLLDAVQKLKSGEEADNDVTEKFDEFLKANLDFDKIDKSLYSKNGVGANGNQIVSYNGTAGINQEIRSDEFGMESLEQGQHKTDDQEKLRNRGAYNRGTGGDSNGGFGKI